MPSIAYKELLTTILFKSYWIYLTDRRLVERYKYIYRGLPSLHPRSYRLGAVLKQVSFGPDIYNNYYLLLSLEHIKCFIRDSLVSLP
jgi:hypothetical protein